MLVGDQIDHNDDQNKGKEEGNRELDIQPIKPGARSFGHLLADIFEEWSEIESGEDVLNCLEGNGKLTRAEEDPGEHNQNERDKHVEETVQSRSDRGRRALRLLLFVFFERAPELCKEIAAGRLYDNVQAVEQSPHDIAPVGSVPQAAQTEGHHRIVVLARLGAAAAAQGDVQIVDQPAVQRHVPAAPEFGDRKREIRLTEVAAEIKAQDTRRTDGGVGITGKVAIDLQRKEDRCQQDRRAAVFVEIPVYRVDNDRSRIGDNHLHKQAVEHHQHTLAEAHQVKAVLSVKLREDIAGLLDRALYDLGEEGYKQRIFKKILFGCDFSFIDVDDIRYQREAHKTDAQRGNETQLLRLAAAEETAKRCGDKIEVFIKPENAQTQHHPDDHPALCEGVFLRAAKSLDVQRNEIGDQRHDDEKQRKRQTVSCVEHIADDQKKRVAQLMRKQKVQHKSRTEQQEEIQSVERHILNHPLV